MRRRRGGCCIKELYIRFMEGFLKERLEPRCSKVTDEDGSVKTGRMKGGGGDCQEKE